MNEVYYCRVSTDEDVKVNALRDQVAESEECIKNNGWKLVDKYIDEGKTGTTSKRDEYNRLLNDIETNKFDVIVIKSQDRLNRNTKDWYLFIDRIVTYKKKLFIYLDNKFYTPDDALVTGIKAILAEEYSRDLSKKLNNAHKNRQKRGTNIIITSNTWGYDKVNKDIVINKKELNNLKNKNNEILTEVNNDVDVAETDIFDLQNYLSNYEQIASSKINLIFGWNLLDKFQPFLYGVFNREKQETL